MTRTTLNDIRRRHEDLLEDIRDHLCTVSCVAATNHLTGPLHCRCKCRGTNHGKLWELPR